MNLRAMESTATRRGSVLVPIVAAIMILGLAGIVVTQSFGAQRVQSVLTVESSRAFWTAEAGSWHASVVNNGIHSAVSFDQGTYELRNVQGASGESEIVGLVGHATRRAAILGPITFDANTGEGEIFTPPLDLVASAASAGAKGAKAFTLDLHSARTYPSVVSSILIGSSNAQQGFQSVTSDGVVVWSNQSFFPTNQPLMDLQDADLTARVVSPDSPLRLRFNLNQPSTGKGQYVVVLNFTDGTASQFSFSIR